MTTRRKVLKGIGALGVIGATPRSWSAGLAVGPCGTPRGSRFCLEEAPFPLGIASGDPTPEGVVLWTRLATTPLDPAARETLPRTVPVQWAIARDATMTDVVAQGTVVATAELGHSVHVDVRGLAPAAEYYYGFAAGGRRSRIGHTRTLPSAPTSLRFGCISCQDFVGLYGAYERLAQEAFDFVLHLGDTIYEFAWDGIAATDLHSFRAKHALFRADPRGRAAWAAHPFVVTWDDHEVRNDYCGTNPAYDTLREAAYQAYYEHMPIRLPEGIPERWREMRIYRALQCGDLLDLSVLDLRQYRDPNPGNAARALAPDRTTLGAAQKRWLVDRIRNGSGRWKCLGSPLFMSDCYSYLDGWDGYPEERRQLLDLARVHGSGRTIVLSGDLHASVVSRLVSGDKSPRFQKTDRVVGIEFCTPALSSKAKFPERPDPDAGFQISAEKPWLVYQDGGYRGYTVCEVQPDRWRTTYRVLKDGNSNCMTTLSSFDVTVADGTPVLETSGFVPFSC